MDADFKKLGSQLRRLWSSWSPARRASLAIILVSTIGALALLMRTPAIQYASLYSGLSPEDASRVSAALDESKTPYRIQNGGTAIEVPAERVDKVRVELAGRGLPQGSGLGFELFDQGRLSTSSFVEKMNYHRALAGELSRTLQAIDAVEKARVHIAMPERSLYRREEAPPSVSVALRLRPGRQLSSGQVRGIVHLVTSSLAKLTPEQVSVVDEGGNVLWSGDAGQGVTSAQRELETTLQRRVSDILDRLVGQGQSVVVVTAEMDAARQERTEERFDKEGVLRSESKTAEQRFANGETIVGVSGVSANLPEGETTPITPTTASRAPSPTSNRSSETRNFEVNRVVTRTEGAKVRVRRIHIAVLINAPSATNTASVAGVQIIREGGATGPSVADLERVTALVREAAGLDPSRGDRVEVQSLPFAATEPDPASAETKTDEPPSIDPTFGSASWIAMGVVGIGALLGFVLVFARRRSEPMIELSGPITASELEARLAAAAPGARPSPADARELSLRDRVQLAAKQDSAAAARILSSWVKERESAKMGGA